jgi:hypothetical protein
MSNIPHWHHEMSCPWRAAAGEPKENTGVATVLRTAVAYWYETPLAEAIRIRMPLIFPPLWSLGADFINIL